MKILLLGANGFGKVHAQSYHNLGFEFSVFSRNKEVIREHKEKFNVTEAFTQIDDAMNSDYDIIDIVLPHNLHLKYAKEAMESGKHVIIEKPIASTEQEAKELISLSRKMNVKFMVAEQYFFDASLRKVQEILSENLIGKIHTIILRDQRIYRKEGWRTEKKVMGGGALIDGGIHYIEAMLDIGGQYDEILSYTYHGGSSLEGEDSSAALFSFRSGAHGIFYYSWAYPNAPSLPAYEVIGSEGSIVEDLETKPKEDFKQQGSPRHAFGLPVLNGKVIQTRIYDVFDREIGDFVSAVRNDTDVPYNPDLALRNLKAITEIYRN